MWKITTFPGFTKKVEVAGQPMNSGLGGEIIAFKEKWNANASQHMPGFKLTRSSSAENVNQLLKASCGPTTEYGSPGSHSNRGSLHPLVGSSPQISAGSSEKV